MKYLGLSTGEDRFESMDITRGFHAYQMRQKDSLGLNSGTGISSSVHGSFYGSWHIWNTFHTRPSNGLISKEDVSTVRCILPTSGGNGR